MQDKKRWVIEFFTKGVHCTKALDIMGAVEKLSPDYFKRYIRFAMYEPEKLVKVGYFRTVDNAKGYLQKWTDDFDKINQMMLDVGLYPLFKDTSNQYECILFAEQLLQYVPESEACKIVGCKSFENHWPLIKDKEKYMKNEKI